MKHYDENEKRLLMVFTFIFIMMAMGITLAAYLSYRNYEEQFRKQVERQLSAVAELKVKGLVNWHKERLDDAETFYRNPAFTALVKLYFENAADAQAREELQIWLDKYEAYAQYDQVSLFDVNGVEMLSAPAPLSEAADSHLKQEIAGSLHSGGITFVDFHREAENDSIRLAFLIPIYADSEASQLLGILLIRVDPNVYLYPYIQEWPVASQVAETLLVRRDGQDVLFLNKLKSAEDAALTLRIPLERNTSLAVQAVLGSEGIVQGVDYRGMPSIGYVRAVPDLPWFLVARMETAEVYAPLRTRIWEMVIFFGALIFTAGAGMGMIWRQRRISYYRGQIELSNALRESEEKLRILFELLPVGVSVLNDDRNVVYSNPALQKILKITQQGISNGSYKTRKYLRADGTPMPAEEFAGMQALKQHKAVWNVETGIVTEDGGIIWTDVSAMPVSLSGWKVVIVTTDVTERKRTQDALIAGEARYRHTLDDMLEGCQIIGLDWRYIYLNDVADRHNRRSKDELLGQKYMDMWPGIESTEVFAAMRRCMEERIPHSMENEFIFPDGGNGWFELRIYPVPEGIVILSIDITGRKRAEHQLANYAERLEETVRERTRELNETQEQLVRHEKLATLGQLAGSIGHELRNPLGVISNAIYFLKLAQPDASDMVREYLQIMENELRTSDKIITDLLDFARTKSADRSQASVSDLIHQTLIRFPPPPSVNVTLHIPHDLPPIFADPHHVIQILGNLVVNACQALPSTGGRVDITAASHDDMVSIAVHDTGAGISPEDARKLFDPLFTTKTKGIGLGLAVSRKLAEANGGRIEFESEAGSGSIFTIWLPIGMENQ